MAYLLFVFVCLFINTGILASLDIPCVAVELLTIDTEEDWDFRIPFWENSTVAVVSSEYNIGPMNGVYTFEYSFCNNIYLYIGNQTQDKNTFGWSFGYLSSFLSHRVTPTNPTPSPVVDQYAAYKGFTQEYLEGDAGAPCTKDIPRSASVNIYCGAGKANCTQVQGSKGAACINFPAKTDPGFCLCSVEYNITYGVCGGLVLNLLSNKCPIGKNVQIPVPAPGNPDNSSRSVGIVFAVLAVIVVVVCICGYIYNFTVHAKRGCQAVPFYDTCTGQADKPAYIPPTTIPVVRGGYGAI